MSCFTGWLEGASRRSAELGMLVNQFDDLKEEIIHTIDRAENWCGKRYDRQSVANQLSDLYCRLRQISSQLDSDISEAFNKNWNRNKRHRDDCI